MGHSSRSLGIIFWVIHIGKRKAIAGRYVGQLPLHALTYPISILQQTSNTCILLGCAVYYYRTNMLPISLPSANCNDCIGPSHLELSFVSLHVSL